jgi:ribosomal protein S4
VHGGDADKAAVKANREASGDREVPAWLSVDAETPSITVRVVPSRDDISVGVREQMVVEILSR